MEDNEWSFCSLWTEKTKTRCGMALVNEKLQGDYFFNRATVEGCFPGAEKNIAKTFWARGMDCYLYFQSTSALPVLDTMYVLTSIRAGKVKGDVRQVSKADLPAWIDVFCRSFGVPEWKDEVKRILAANFGKLELLLSYKDGAPAGCAALYKKSGLTGLYCLGTVSSHRREGLARDMLSFAQQKTEGMLLFLQTLASEDLIGLYRKSGFAVSHTKQICVLKKPD